MNRLATYLTERAKRTPYFHLAGYMNRWWLVPYTYAGSHAHSGDGTGWVSWRRPFARVLQHLGVAVRVHEILRSDTGRDPHDHPWPYVTVILRGGYHEERYNADGTLLSVKWHGPGSVLFRRASDLHKLTLVQHPACHDSDFDYKPGAVCYAARWEEPATTLFIAGRHQQRWGFLTPAGKVTHDEYRKS